eukprot:7304097-Prymnesium_polylepis.1
MPKPLTPPRSGETLRSGSGGASGPCCASARLISCSRHSYTVSRTRRGAMRPCRSAASDGVDAWPPPALMRRAASEGCGHGQARSGAGASAAAHRADALGELVGLQVLAQCSLQAGELAACRVDARLLLRVLLTESAYCPVEVVPSAGGRRLRAERAAGVLTARAAKGHAATRRKTFGGPALRPPHRPARRLCRLWPRYSRRPRAYRPRSAPPRPHLSTARGHQRQCPCTDRRAAPPTLREATAACKRAGAGRPPHRAAPAGPSGPRIRRQIGGTARGSQKRATSRRSLCWCLLRPSSTAPDRAAP